MSAVIHATGILLPLLVYAVAVQLRLRYLRRECARWNAPDSPLRRGVDGRPPDPRIMTIR